MANPQTNEVRRLIRLGLPLVLTFASDWGLVTTATIASSWISASAVAAVGLTFTLGMSTVAFFFVTLSALTVITADLLGSGRSNKVGALMKSGLSLAAVFCGVLAAMLVVLWCLRQAGTGVSWGAGEMILEIAEKSVETRIRRFFNLVRVCVRVIANVL